MSWGVIGVWGMSIICCVVIESMAMIVDWIDMNGVGIVVDWLMVYFVGEIVVDWLMVDFVVDIVMVVVMIVVVNIVMSVNMVSWLSNMRSRVVVMVGSSDDWVNSVLFSVLVLSLVLGFPVLSWSIVSVGWLSVRVLMDVNNWMMVGVMWVVWISSWVGVDSLVVVVNGFTVDWMNLMFGVLFAVMRDSLVWNNYIPFRSVVLMVFMGVSVVVMIV